jgi:hypothetical protein
MTAPSRPGEGFGDLVVQVDGHQGPTFPSLSGRPLHAPGVERAHWYCRRSVFNSSALEVWVRCFAAKNCAKSLTGNSLRGNPGNWGGLRGYFIFDTSYKFW